MSFKMLIIKLMKLKLRVLDSKCGPYYFTKILQREGIEVGNHTIFYNPLSQTIDRQRPWMLKIGDYCKITKGVTILCHDYSRSVLRRVYGDIVGEAKETVIGSNVFIGVNSIILMGAHIGDNVIIGAGSVVGGNIPSNCVVAGNPARVITSLDNHYDKRKRSMLSEAKIYYMSFVARYHREPSEMEMGPFFSLFLDRSREELERLGINTNLNGDDEEEVITSFLNSSPRFSTFEEFKIWAKE